MYDQKTKKCYRNAGHGSCVLILRLADDRYDSTELKEIDMYGGDTHNMNSR